MPSGRRGERALAVPSERALGATVPSGHCKSASAEQALGSAERAPGAKRAP